MCLLAFEPQIRYSIEQVILDATILDIVFFRADPFGYSRGGATMAGAVGGFAGSARNLLHPTMMTPLGNGGGSSLLIYLLPIFLVDIKCMV